MESAATLRGPYPLSLRCGGEAPKRLPCRGAERLAAAARFGEQRLGQGLGIAAAEMLRLHILGAAGDGCGNGAAPILAGELGMKRGKLRGRRRLRASDVILPALC